jgi:hypothetical protein
VVHHASKAIATPHRFRLPLLLSAILATAALAASGCGSGSSNQPQSGAGPNVGQPISLADCGDWNQANTEQRLGTIDQLKGFAGGPVIGNDASSPSGTGSVLDDEKAYDLFNNWCKQDFARGFKLYKLYERAAAFTGQPQ